MRFRLALWFLLLHTLFGLILKKDFNRSTVIIFFSCIMNWLIFLKFIIRWVFSLLSWKHYGVSWATIFLSAPAVFVLVEVLKNFMIDIVLIMWWRFSWISTTHTLKFGAKSFYWIFYSPINKVFVLVLQEHQHTISSSIVSPLDMHNSMTFAVKNYSPMEGISPLMIFTRWSIIR